MQSGEIGDLKVDLSGKNALVTGATKGIGREVALSLAAAGCNVAATGRDSEELASLAREISVLGRRCETMAADLASAKETMEMAETLSGRMDPLDILVNNAGTSFPETLLDLELEHWDATLNVNLRAPALISKIVADKMVRRRQGVIINVGSASGVLALEQHAAYCASKFGLHGLTKVMALELGPYNIRVNAIAPTIVLTPMGQKVWSDPVKNKPMMDRIPIRRFAFPRDIANVVLFLVSPASSMINGEVLMVDGGYSAH